MSKKQKLLTPEIFRQAVLGSFVKLNPRYMMKNPVMFVVEVGFAITLVLSFFPGLFGDAATSNLRAYNIIVSVVLFITVLFANFAESVAEGRGKAQAASLKKTQKDSPQEISAMILQKLKKDAEGYPGPPAASGRNRRRRAVQRTEKRRHRAGIRR